MKIVIAEFRQCILKGADMARSRRLGGQGQAGRYGARAIAISAGRLYCQSTYQGARAAKQPALIRPCLKTALWKPIGVT
ncbi:hypothetical protein ABBQ38_000457 [Trebouxia sp. C0009 RCD-2024]